tara:strand:+ start:336 stop:1202 length:867 start_codon:yes stop_codon:yes gene_type:complete
MTKHNKKRNIGIMYELLLRHISAKLIEGDKKAAEVATKIIEKRFSKDKELYKEFRLFNALAKTSVQNTEVAAAILTEAKNAARRFNNNLLEKEKSLLIRDINYKIKDKTFYYRSVPDYREYANIHNMIKEWQKKDMSDLKSMVILEQKALNHLMAEKNKENNNNSNDIDAKKSNILVEKIMSEKINKKYSEFSISQRQILQKYALYSNNQNTHEKLRKFLLESKKIALNTLENFSNLNNNEYLAKKISLVENKIKDLDVTILNDKTVTKFLTLTKLVDEINSGEKNVK